MTSRAMLSFALAAFVFASPAVNAAVDEDAGHLVPAKEAAEFVLRAVEAAPEACPQDFRDEFADREHLCAAFPRSFSFFKMSIDDAVDRWGMPVRVVPRTPWTYHDGEYRRDFAVGAKHPLTVVFRPDNGRVLMAYDPAGPGEAEAMADEGPPARVAAAGSGGGARIPMAGFAGITKPVLIRDVDSSPRIPEAARIADTGGRATVKLLVRADGSVAEAHVVREDPEGLDFGQACVDAARGWRFEPARRDGQPLEVWFTTSCEFDVR